MLHSQTRRCLLAIVSAFSLLGATGASAEQAEDCDAVFFPDLKCDREARPEGAFNPVGMPYLFEDPHITTGLNFAYIYHQFPTKGGLGRHSTAAVPTCWLCRFAWQ